MKQQFIDLLKSTQREGIDELIKWLETKTDFFTAPASTKYHGSYEGGLLEHSLSVHYNLQKIVGAFTEVEISQDTSCAIAALLHDICKVNFYKQDTRNVKVNGTWEQVPYYTIEDKIPLGHGEKSVIILQRYIRLTIDEIMAIRWHMAGYDDSRGGYGGGQALSAAMTEYPLITLLHMADLAANYIDKK